MGAALCTSDVCNVVSRVIVAVESNVVVSVRSEAVEELDSEAGGCTRRLLLLTELAERLLEVEVVETAVVVVDRGVFEYLGFFEILLFVDNDVVSAIAEEVATAADMDDVV